MRALVSGASGFIGRHAVARLFDRGDDVIAISRPGRAATTRSLLGRSIDVIEDPGSVSTLVDLLSGLAIDATLHLAGRLDSQPNVDEIDAVVEANIGFPSRLVAAVAVAAPTSVFVNAGTVRAYGGRDGSGSMTLYGATKRAFSEVLSYYGSSSGLQARTLVLPWVYGPGQAGTSVVPLLVHALATGEPLDATSGSAELDLLHVDDAVAGLLMAVDPEHGGGRWMLSSGTTITPRDIVDDLERMAQRPVPVRWGALPGRSMPGEVLDGSAPVLPGWSPTVSLPDGLSRLLLEAGVS